MPTKAQTLRQRFRSRDLREQLLAYPTARRYIVGFSGGADSTALLTALHRQRARLEARIEAVHFNHGLHNESSSWQRHCERFCAEREIPLTCHSLELSGDPANLEARARELRYRHIEDQIEAETLYLTAHQADDLAETFLLHVLRGSGIDGLAGIPEIRPLGRGYVVRPVLGFSRRALIAYLEGHGIGWIEDPSNLDTSLDRNFVRQEVIPLLQSRWPAARAALARTAGHLRTAGTVLSDLLVRYTGMDALESHALPLDVLWGLGDPASSLVLREWLRRHDVPPLPEARLDEFLDQLSTAGPEARCEVGWAGWSLRLFRNELRLVPPGDCPECPEREWDATPRLNLGPGLGSLQISGKGKVDPSHWTVGPRQPGRNIQLRPGGPSRKLKKVFQEQPIPPWQRMSIPVLYWGDRPVAVGDWLRAPQFQDWLERQGLAYQWQPENPELRRTRAKCHEFLGREHPA